MKNSIALSARIHKTTDYFRGGGTKCTNTILRNTKNQGNFAKLRFAAKLKFLFRGIPTASLERGGEDTV